MTDKQSGQHAPARTERGNRRRPRSGQPVVVLLDLLGRRWSLRVLWEIYQEPGQTFRMLQASCGDISSSVLGTRLRELSDAGIVERSSSGYELSQHGLGLTEQLVGLDAWARRWARRGSMPH